MDSVFYALNSIFKSIDMGAGHKLLLQLFLIGFCFFIVKLEKDRDKKL